MALVIGYLRRNCEVSIARQKEMVAKLAQEKGFKNASPEFVIEKHDGASKDWPKLKQFIQRCADDVDLGTLGIIPTWVGVQFNLSFLQILDRCDAPIFVCSGWRRPKRTDQGTNCARKSTSSGWLLSLSIEAAALAEIVDRVRARNNKLSPATRRGIKASCKTRKSNFTKAGRKKGGDLRGKQRQKEAVALYSELAPDIVHLRSEGRSIMAIVRYLANHGILTPEGRRIGPSLVYRVLTYVESLLGEESRFE